MAEEESFRIEQIFDPTCDWTIQSGSLLYNIADRCLKRNKRTRPNMADVIDTLQK